MNLPSASPAHRLVAIVGGSGAGKSWLTRRLCALFGEHACPLSLDDFYRDRSHLSPKRREQLNFDIPRALDWDCAEQVLQDCLAGQPTRLPSYDFSTHTRSTSTVALLPKPLILAEGLWLLQKPTTRRLFTYKLYLDCPESVRLSRRRRRDVSERGRTAEDIERKLLKIAALHQRYVEPQKRWADLILTQPYSRADLLRLAENLWQLREAGAPQPERKDTFFTNLLALLQTDENPN